MAVSRQVGARRAKWRWWRVVLLSDLRDEMGWGGGVGDAAQ